MNAFTSVCLTIAGVWVAFTSLESAPRRNYSVSVFRYIDGKKYVLLCNFHLDILGEIDAIADKLIKNYQEKNWQTKILEQAYNDRGKVIDNKLMRSIWGHKPGGNLNRKRDNSPRLRRAIWRTVSNNTNKPKVAKRKAHLN
ncbi:MAG: hypothetical protein KA028_00455 [Candidatus Pacebacteria bacterium]|nr:hypothetical protein [Candidatus Paceibacterota bacterium]MBP9851975.1 hypothetical protein [Candidatus Paceibacterota bacterium]